MRRFLLASAAASGLALVAFPAFAQITAPVQNPPPVAAQLPEADAMVHGQAGANVSAPAAQMPDRTVAPAANAAGDAVRSAQPATPRVPEITAQTSGALGTPSATAQTGAVANTMPAPSATQRAQVQTPAASAGVQTASAPANASEVCATRTTSVHFGGGSALSQQNRDAIQYATDAASACALQNIVIASSGTSNAATRRANAIRSVLVRQGVPEEKISVEPASADANASTGQADVRMTFAGPASASTGAVLEPTALSGVNAAASASTNVAMTAAPVARAPMPSVAPAAPAAMPSATPKPDADSEAGADVEMPATDDPNS